MIALKYRLLHTTTSDVPRRLLWRGCSRQIAEFRLPGCSTLRLLSARRPRLKERYGIIEEILEAVTFENDSCVREDWKLLKEHRTDSVYGITREVPLNYVARDSVDNSFIESLSLDKHIVIYGSSKQGKTCLRKHCLLEEDYIMVQCNNRWTLENILGQILKQAGYKIILSERKTQTGRHKIIASISANLFGVGAGTGAETENQHTLDTETKGLELDPTDVNDIINALNQVGFKKYIVVEDFHYLPVEVQKDFSVALKAFHEASDFCFIVVGVWLEENRLIVYNGDLTGRVLAVDADEWKAVELSQVIDTGAELLNVEFDEKFKKDLVRESNDSVYIVQEVCRQACDNEKILKTQKHSVVVGKESNVRELVKKVVDEQTGRYIDFITKFSGGFQETRLEMYKWLLLPVITAEAEKLEEGFTYADLRREIREKHPSKESLNLGNLTQALQSTASLQTDKDIKPIILDYDQTSRRLNVVDRGFLIWREYQDQSELLDIAGIVLD